MPITCACQDFWSFVFEVSHTFQLGSWHARRPGGSFSTRRRQTSGRFRRNHDSGVEGKGAQPVARLLARTPPLARSGHGRSGDADVHLSALAKPERFAGDFTSPPAAARLGRELKQQLHTPQEPQAAPLLLQFLLLHRWRRWLLHEKPLALDQFGLLAQREGACTLTLSRGAPDAEQRSRRLRSTR